MYPIKLTVLVFNSEKKRNEKSPHYGGLMGLEY